MSNQSEHNLEKILTALGEGKAIQPNSGHTFSLITPRALNLSNLKEIQTLCGELSQLFEAKVSVVGAEKRCSKLDFRVELPDTPEAAETIKNVLGCAQFQEFAQRWHFTSIVVAIVPIDVNQKSHTVVGSPGVGFTQIIKNQTIKMNADNSSNKINGSIVGSNVSVDSTNVSQKQNIYININPQIASILEQISKVAKEDPTIDTGDQKRIEAELEIIREELSKNSPKESVLSKCFKTLENFASLASLLNKLIPFLPTVGA